LLETVGHCFNGEFSAMASIPSPYHWNGINKLFSIFKRREKT
jgi:hypothetical protein